MPGGFYAWLILAMIVDAPLPFSPTNSINWSMDHCLQRTEGVYVIKVALHSTNWGWMYLSFDGGDMLDSDGSQVDGLYSASQ